ncbi:hypothetical protein PMIN01_06810 [Paraphaeosphaeria minitans]|uniref:Uncharacterized protein n=1 Tax=Paraphaeosphaeria minitans TaxID=565426 RepID=A0A9P6GI20_9PLEO|nr:hypothetical protein PMIN01_06810 [Paraphaeosphaeria minitans]
MRWQAAVLDVATSGHQPHLVELMPKRMHLATLQLARSLRNSQLTKNPPGSSAFSDAHGGKRASFVIEPMLDRWISVQAAQASQPTPHMAD